MLLLLLRSHLELAVHLKLIIVAVQLQHYITPYHPTGSLELCKAGGERK